MLIRVLYELRYSPMRVNVSVVVIAYLQFMTNTGLYNKILIIKT